MQKWEKEKKAKMKSYSWIFFEVMIWRIVTQSQASLLVNLVPSDISEAFIELAQGPARIDVVLSWENYMSCKIKSEKSRILVLEWKSNLL